MSDPTALVYAYPEDVRLSGPAAIADTLERLGADGIALAVTYHPARRVLPRHGVVAHAPPGARWLAPRGDYYPDGLRPRRTGDAATERAVHELRAELARRDLAFHAWLVVLHCEPLVAARPDLAATTLDGTPTVHALCAAWPDVRAYAAALVADVCRQLAPDGVELEAALPAAWLPSYVVSLELAPLAGRERALAGICVCGACRQLLGAAGTEPDEALVDARRGEPPTALLAVRRRLAADALEAAAGAARRHGAFARALLFGEVDDLRWQGACPEALAGVDGVGIGTGTASGAALREQLVGLAPLAGDRPLLASMNWAPERTPTGFAADVRAAAGAGASAVALYNLSLVPADGLPALAAAARAARRYMRPAEASTR